MERYFDATHRKIYEHRYCPETFIVVWVLRFSDSSDLDDDFPNMLLRRHIFISIPEVLEVEGLVYHRTELRRADHTAKLLESTCLCEHTLST